MSPLQRLRNRASILRCRVELGVLQARIFPGRCARAMHDALLEVGDGVLSTTAEDYERLVMMRTWRHIGPMFAPILVGGVLLSFVAMRARAE